MSSFRFYGQEDWMDPGPNSEGEDILMGEYLPETINRYLPLVELQVQFEALNAKYKDRFMSLHLWITEDDDYYSSISKFAQVFGVRPENEEEKEQRLKTEKKKVEERELAMLEYERCLEKRDQDEYRRLKEKYGNA